MTTICDSSSANSRRLRSPDFANSCTEDECLAKNLLRSVASDDDDDGAATGRLRPPSARDHQPSGCPCTSTSSEWRISEVFAVPTRDCPFCWAPLPVVDDCQNCSAVANQSSHRRSTPGIQITSSTESLTFSTSGCIHDDRQDDANSSKAKRRCSSLATDIDAVPAAVPCRSVPDITRNSPHRRTPPTPPPPPPPPVRDRWLSAGVASLPRPTALHRADILPACLHSPAD